MSLLLIHTFIRDNDDLNNKRANPSFFSDDEYTRFFIGVAESSWLAACEGSELLEKDKEDDFIRSLSDSMRYVLESTVIVDFYFTSALVNIPISLKTDVRQMVAEAGYIQSGGRAIYTSKAAKSTKDGFETKLKNFLTSYSDKKLFLAPYAQEMFPADDERSLVSLRNGLAGVRLQLKKHYIGGAPLYQFLATLESRLQVKVPDGIQNVREQRRNDKDTEQRSTVWIICDYGITPLISSCRPPLLDRVQRDNECPYIIVYELALTNDNQFIVLKERKPGWYGPITVPHTLSAAVTNVIRASDTILRRRTKTPLIVLDPFFGTGTFLFDAALRLDNAIIVGFDRDPRSFSATRDNAAFFGLGPRDLSAKLGLVSKCIDLLEGRSIETIRMETEQCVKTCEPNRTFNESELFSLVFNLIDNSILSPKALTDLDITISSRILLMLKFGWSNELLNKFLAEGLDEDQRFLIYILWRAISLGTYNIRNSLDNIPSVLLTELRDTKREINLILKNVRSAAEAEPANFCQTQSDFSQSMSVHFKMMDKLSKETKSLSIADFEANGGLTGLSKRIWLINVVDSLESLSKIKSQVDVILTDPPYGFNAEEGGNKALMDNFGRLGPLLVGALASSGQMAIALPAFAKNGRQVPYYETGETLTRQLIAAAHSAERPLISEVRTFPAPKELFRKPYYWVSTNILERRILHFAVK